MGEVDSYTTQFHNKIPFLITKETRFSFSSRSTLPPALLALLSITPGIVSLYFIMHYCTCFLKVESPARINRELSFTIISTVSDQIVNTENVVSQDLLF